MQERLKLVFEPIEASELVGTWIFDRRESVGVSNLGGVQIHLFLNGRCTIKDLPVNESLVKWLGPVINAEAEWKIVKGLNGEIQIQFIVNNSTAVDMDVMRNQSGELYLASLLKQPDDLHRVVLGRDR